MSPSTASQTESSHPLAALPLGRGTLSGLAAFLAGYLLTYVSTAGSVEERLRGVNAVADLLGGQPVPVWKGVGWLFYNAHLVGTNVPSLGGPATRDFVAATDGGAAAALYLLPPLVLALAGFAVARLNDARTVGEGAAAGATVVVAYLPLAVVGVFLFTHRAANGDVSVGPDLATGVLLAGLLYPLACGAVGGAFAGR